MGTGRMAWLGSCVIGVWVLGGCAAEVTASESTVDTAESEASWAREVAFEAFTDPAGVGNATRRETRVLITKASQYGELFGHDAPREIEFRRGDAVVFYAAGTKPTGGYQASVVSIVRGWRGLVVTTRLTSPGGGCLVTQALTEPYVLVKLRARALRHPVEFLRDDRETDCDRRSCEDLVCPTGEHCEMQQVVCIRAPCYPVPTCVRDVPKGPMCGGIAGIPCPGEGSCIDDPSDSCDPATGGRDCSGVCQCDTEVRCESGLVFDTSPEVCACVADPALDPCASVRCKEGTQCVANGGTAECVPMMDPCAAALCPTGSRCEVYEGAPRCVSDGTMACGSSLCPAGNVCCNASCGICTPPDGACIQMACVEGGTSE